MPLNDVHSNWGGAKNITCNFCDTSFTMSFSTRAFAHILGRDILGQKRPNVGTCVPKLRFGMLVLSQVIKPSFLPSPVQETEELVCSWAHPLGSAQQACASYD